MSLLIQAGKYYRTRSKQKAFVYAVAANPFLAGSCALAFGFIEGYGEERWDLEGDSSGENSGRDLIEEWKEPVTKEVLIGLYRSKDGEYEWFRLLTGTNDHWTLLGSRRIMLREGEFIDNKPDAPVERTYTQSLSCKIHLVRTPGGTLLAQTHPDGSCPVIGTKRITLMEGEFTN